jgi:rubrerythrin
MLDTEGARASVQRVEGGFEVFVQGSEWNVCPYEDDYERFDQLYRPRTRVTLFVSREGVISERARIPIPSQSICDAMGRRPEGFAEVVTAPTLRGYVLAAMHREAESVRAFLRLADELEHHGAPAALIARARRSAEDERRHAQRCAALASELGPRVEPALRWVAPLRNGTPRPSGAAHLRADLPVRGLEAVALENAVEGCVHEAYGAAAAAYQAVHARWASARAHFRAITRDEIRHAALACDVHELLSTRLPADARARVERAAREARASLEASFREPSGPVADAIGSPSVAHARRLSAASTTIA